MSIVTLPFGQCGIQIGEALFSNIHNDINSDKITGKRGNLEYVSQAVDKWFHVNKSGKFEARSILIDTETKVAAAVLNNNNNHMPYKFKNILAKSHGGAANNWAFGYSAISKLMMGEIVETVRREIEKCDCVSSILSLLGSAGGTGSGVGSKTIEVLRDEYPSKAMINVIVLPYRSGEVVTQNYNSLLTLAKLYNITDATYLYENDVVHRMCSKTLSLTDVTFQDVNSIIAQQLAAALQPVGNISISQIVASLAAHPSYKFVQTKSAPHIIKEHSAYETPSTWTMLVNRIRTSLKLNAGVYNLKSPTELGRKIKCVGNMLFSRGHSTPLEKELKSLSDLALYVPWLPTSIRFTHQHQRRGFKDLNKFLLLSTNNNSVCSPIDFILEDAWTVFTHGAYLHHYKKFGVDEQYFNEAFEKMEGILRDYQSL